MGTRPPAGRTAQDQGGTSATAETADEASVITLADLDTVSTQDVLARERLRQITRRLSFRRPARDNTARRGVGDLVSARWQGSSDEMDLDGTLDAIAAMPLPEDEDIIVRERVRTRRSVAVLVDVSGSMKGERIRTAAATVGALGAELSHDQVAVIAFWSDAAVLVNLGDPLEPLVVLDLLLRMPTRGLTNVAFPLELALNQLASAPPRQSRVLLLSDCMHNAGPDPRSIAVRLPRLDVLLDVSGEHDLELGRDLARLGRGECRVVRDHRQVAPALTALFD